MVAFHYCCQIYNKLYTCMSHLLSKLSPKNHGWFSISPKFSRFKRRYITHIHRQSINYVNFLFESVISELDNRSHNLRFKLTPIPRNTASHQIEASWHGIARCLSVNYQKCVFPVLRRSHIWPYP